MLAPPSALFLGCMLACTSASRPDEDDDDGGAGGGAGTSETGWGGGLPGGPDDPGQVETGGETGGGTGGGTGGSTGGPGSGIVQEGDMLVYEVSAAEGEGYLTIDLTEVQGGTVHLTAYVDGDQAWWEGNDLDDRDMNAWMTVSPGHEYLFEVDGSSSGAAPLTCRATITHHAVPDPWEPNDDLDEAVAVHGTLQGYFHAGHESTSVTSEEYDDWYLYESDGSRFEIALTDVPDDLTAGIEVWDAADLTWTLDWESAWDEGMDVVLEVRPERAGAHYIRVYGWGLYAQGTGDPPDSLTSPYTLTVGAP